MRCALLALALLAACPAPGPDGACGSDADCSSGDVCANDELCWPSSDVQTAHVTWTIDGAAPNSSECAGYSDLSLTFWSQNQAFGYSPVDCVEGEFTAQALPDIYTEAELTAEAGYVDMVAAIVNGSASFDLPP